MKNPNVFLTQLLSVLPVADGAPQTGPLKCFTVSETKTKCFLL